MVISNFAFNTFVLGSILPLSIHGRHDNNLRGRHVQQGNMAGDWCWNSPNSSQFTVQVEFNDDSSTTTKAMCAFSYKNGPFDDGKVLGGDGAWTAQSGNTFNYLETRTFYVSDNTHPSNIYINDESGTYNCARALYKNEFYDFHMGTGSIDKIADWWGQGDEPVHITVVPFYGDDSSCGISSDGAFDTARSVAIWLSSYSGQDSDPNDGSVYCDVSSNPENCLNEPYYGIENDELVLYGTLHNVLRFADQVNIYVPEGFDLNLPINNLQVRFKINGAAGNFDGCSAFAANPNSGASCFVDSAYTTYETTKAKISVSGLGRIVGWNAMKTQYYNGWDNFPAGDVQTYSNIYDWTEKARFQIDANLLALSSINQSGDYTDLSNCWGGGQNNYAIDVSGVQVAWGSRLGQSPIQLNSYFNGESEDTSKYCAKMHDLKYVGNWNDQADGPDIIGGGSLASFNYLHTCDDGIKVASDVTKFLDTTMLQGSAGSAIMLGSYGLTRENGIAGSLVDGVYVHRSLQNNNPCGNFRNTGGLISTRGCPIHASGLTDATVNNLHLPALGSNDNGANSVGQPFGIGVDTESGYCDSYDTTLNSYPIKNLVFTNINIYVNPSCTSRFYDNTGKVDWGDKTMIVYDEMNSDPSKCDFQGAVAFSEDPYFVCGVSQESDAKYCMTADGVGGTANIEFDQKGGNVNLVEPWCEF